MRSRKGQPRIHKILVFHGFSVKLQTFKIQFKNGVGENHKQDGDKERRRSLPFIDVSPLMLIA